MCLPHRMFTVSEVPLKYRVIIVTPFLTTGSRNLGFKARGGLKYWNRATGCRERERGRKINDLKKGRREKKRNKKNEKRRREKGEGGVRRRRGKGRSDRRRGK